MLEYSHHCRGYRVYETTIPFNVSRIGLELEVTSLSLSLFLSVISNKSGIILIESDRCSARIPGYGSRGVWLTVEG